MEWFGISANTARDWLAKWRDEGFVQPLRPDAERVRAYVLTESWSSLLNLALSNASNSTS